MSNTPNVVIENPTTRKAIGAILNGLAILSACAATVLGFWPELSGLQPDPARVISTINALVSLLTGVFGLAVTLPNIPKSDVYVPERAENDAPDESEPTEGDAEVL